MQAFRLSVAGRFRVARVLPRGFLASAFVLGALLASLPTALAGPARVADDGLGGVPNSAIVQSRCGALAISTHVARIGETITAEAGPKHPEACNGSATWTWPLFPGLTVLSGCKPDGGSCKLKATASTPLVDQVGGGGGYVTYPPGPSAYTTICLAGNSGFGGWESCQYYAVVGKETGVIEGYIKDRDDNPVSGIPVRAVGASPVVGSTGKDGFYALVVKPGDHHVVPEAGPGGKRESTFRPDSTAVAVTAGQTAKADFVLEGGIQVQLSVSSATAATTGFAIVKGTVKTTLYGYPDPGVTVALWPKSNQDADAAVRDGARGTSCASGARLWPGGTLSDPDGSPVNITTNQDGEYDFTIDVGTVPGPFKLTAWARDASGQLIAVDTVDTSDDVTLDFTGPAGAAGKLGTFLDDLKGYVKSKLATFSVNPVTFGGQLASGTESGNGEVDSTGFPVLAGLAFAPGVGQVSGYALLVYPADDPPSIDGKGVLAGASGALVISPGNWTTIAAKVTYPDLFEALQASAVEVLPTFAQWQSGADVPGWNLKAQTMSVYQQIFQYYGWPYPSTTPGACW